MSCQPAHASTRATKTSAAAPVGYGRSVDAPRLMKPERPLLVVASRVRRPRERHLPMTSGDGTLNASSLRLLVGGLPHPRDHP